jgi:hypothetical protein
MTIVSSAPAAARTSADITNSAERALISALTRAPRSRAASASGASVADAAADDEQVARHGVEPEAVSKRPEDVGAIAGPQRREATRAQPRDLIQERDLARCGIGAVYAHRASQERRGIGRGALQLKELAGAGERRRRAAGQHEEPIFRVYGIVCEDRRGKFRGGLALGERSGHR